MHDPAPQEKIGKLERVLRGYHFPLQEVVPLFAALLSLPHPDQYPPINLTPQKQRQKIQEALVAWLLEEGERGATLAAWEDLHWADPSTLELLCLFLDQAPINWFTEGFDTKDLQEAKALLKELS